VYVTCRPSAGLVGAGTPDRDVSTYFGRYLYRLVPDGDSYKIRFRRAELDVETLDSHGTLSIIL